MPLESSDPIDGPPRSLGLRLLSWNLRHRPATSDSRRRWQRIVELIDEWCPSVCCLQEVGSELLIFLHRQLHSYAIHAPGLGRPGERREHLAILARQERWQWLERGRWLQAERRRGCYGPAADAALPRQLVTARLSDQAGELRVLNLHADHRGPRSRSAMARHIRDHHILADDPAALLVAGDLNAQPQSEAYRILTSADAGFVDSGDPPGDGGTATWHFGPFQRRLDYVFCHRRLQVIAHRVLAHESRRRHISDHRPIVVDCARSA